MKEFQIEIKEQLARVETIRAESIEDAIDKAAELYYGQEIILDAEDMKGVSFQPMREKVWERIPMVKNKEQVKMVLIGVFYGTVFAGQMIAWTIINHIRANEKPMWFVAGIAALMTVITCSVYLLFRRLFQKFRGGEETTIVEDVYEIIRTDR